MNEIRLTHVLITVSGRDLWVLALGPNADRHVHLRPEVKYVGNMHGNEVGSTVDLLTLKNTHMTSLQRSIRYSQCN